MKKVFLTLFTLLLVSGCRCSTGLEERGNGIYIHITNNTGIDVYGLEVNMENSSHMIVNADGNKMGKGETMVIELLK